MELKRIKKILVVNLGGIGDVLLSLAALKALRSEYKDVAIDGLVVERVGELAANCGLFDEIFHYKNNLLERLALMIRLRRKRYDLVINMRTMVSGSSAMKIRLLFSAINGRVWAGRDTDSHGGFFDISIPETLRGDKCEMEYDIELVEKLGGRVSDRSIPYNIDPESEFKINRILKDASISEGDILIGIHPGGKSSHRWPVENFAELMKRLAGSMRCSFVITGDSREKDLARKLIAASGLDAVNLAGRLSLDETAALIKRSSLFISNDTAPMHMAAVLKVPLVAIFGPGYLNRFDPRNISENAVVVRKPTECAPCDRNACTDMRCLKSVGVPEVADAALKLLKAA